MNRPHSIKFASQGRTKQAHKAECDINNIMAKYLKTGLIAHGNAHAAHYDYCTSADFQQCMEVVAFGDEMFADLPAAVRSQFQNDPVQFLDFVQNPDNEARLVELGLAKPRTAAPEPSPAPTPDPAPSPAEPPQPPAFDLP